MFSKLMLTSLFLILLFSGMGGVNNTPANIENESSELITEINHEELLNRCVPEGIDEDDVAFACGISGGCGFGSYVCSAYCMTFSDGCQFVSFVQGRFHLCQW